MKTAEAEQAKDIVFDSKHELLKELNRCINSIMLLTNMLDISKQNNTVLSNSSFYNTAEICSKIEEEAKKLQKTIEYTDKLMFDYFKLPYFK